MFLTLFLGLVALILGSLVAASFCFTSITDLEEHEIETRLKWVMRFGILNGCAVVAAIALVILRIFGYIR